MVTLNTNVTLQLSTLYKKESTTDSPTSDNQSKTSKDDFNLNSQVKISSEGKKKLKQEQEQDDLDTTIKNKIKEQAEKTTDKLDQAEKKDILDKLIEDIQKQIKELQKKIKALSHDNTEAAKAQKQALEGQLISLSSALMDLIGKKMDNLKA